MTESEMLTELADMVAAAMMGDTSRLERLWADAKLGAAVRQMPYYWRLCHFPCLTDRTVDVWEVFPDSASASVGGGPTPDAALGDAYSREQGYCPSGHTQYPTRPDSLTVCACTCEWCKTGCARHVGES